MFCIFFQACLVLQIVLTLLYFSLFSFSIMPLFYLSAASHFLLISPFSFLPVLSCVCLLLSLFPSVLFSSLSTNLVLTSFLPSYLSPWAFLRPASDIQTLPRVYFFDSYATLQANGSDSRFLLLLRVLHSHSSLPPLLTSLRCFLSALFLIAVCLFVSFFSFFFFSR